MVAPRTQHQPSPTNPPSHFSSAGGLARLQRVLAGAVLAGALSWLLVWWPFSVPVAITGSVLIALGHMWILAIECIASALVNRRSEPGPHPGLAAWLRAWATECVHTPRVFYWRQPFFSQAVPDHLPPPGPAAERRRGVVLIHGFVCNRGFWTPWLRRLRQAGHPFVAVNLEPIAASIDDYAPIIEQAVLRVTESSGQPPLLVCHSMGGLAARAWLRRRACTT